MKESLKKEAALLKGEVLNHYQWWREAKDANGWQHAPTPDNLQNILTDVLSLRSSFYDSLSNLESAAGLRNDHIKRISAECNNFLEHSEKNRAAWMSLKDAKILGDATLSQLEEYYRQTEGLVERLRDFAGKYSAT